jgi:L-alanine-DL-glutamate epimerase-like enolase superfamily enzyme
MKVDDIVIHVHRAKLNPIWPRPHRFRCDDGEAYSGLVRIIAEDGTEGYAGIGGEPTVGAGYSRAIVQRTASEILGLIKKELLGHDVFDREWLWTQRYVYHWWGHIQQRSVSTIDCGLWDLAGRLLGLPVYKLLGAAREKAPCYASGPWYPDVENHAILAAKAKALGYPAFKIKPGGEPVASIKRITSAVRDAVGDDMELMLDGQTAYSYEQALVIGKHLQDLNFKWFEDPVRNTDFAALELLGQKLDIPIAWCDHASTRLADMVDWIRRPGGPRILRSDVGKDGLTGLMKLAAIADAFGMKCEVHAPGVPHVNAVMAIGNCDYYEDCLNGMLDKLDTNLRRRDPSSPLHVDERGYISAPTMPGLAPAPDLAKLEADTVAVLR